MGSEGTAALELESRNGVEESNNGGLWGKILDLEEAKKQIMLSVPMSVTYLSYYSISLVSVMFAGHLGKVEFAGSTLGHAWATATGFALMIGLSGALETYCGQAYGARLYGMLGVYLQSLMITTFVFAIPVSLIWFYTEPILILLKQEPAVAKMAAIYTKHLIPGLLAYGLLQCMLRFVQTQTILLPLVICSVVPLTIHIGINYFLIHCTVLGIKGAALSATMSLWVSLIMLAIYVYYSEKFQYTWRGWFSFECFSHVIPCMKLAVPSALMVCLEYWVFDILVVVAGMMENPEKVTPLVAMCVNTETVAFMLIYGFSAVVSTRVSHELGAGNIDKAKNAAAVALKISIIIALTIMLSLLIGHKKWASLFSNNYDINTEFASMTPLLLTSIFIDCAQAVLSGVCRGAGWQHLAAWTNLGAFYSVGTPSSLLLGFKAKLYAKGLWIGMILGLFVQTCILMFIAARTNWMKVITGATVSRGDISA